MQIACQLYTDFPDIMLVYIYFAILPYYVGQILFFFFLMTIEIFHIKKQYFSSPKAAEGSL